MSVHGAMDLSEHTAYLILKEESVATIYLETNDHRRDANFDKMLKYFSYYI